MAHEWGNESEDTSNDAFSEIDFQDGHYRNNNRRGNNNSNKFDGPRNDRMTEDIEVVHTRSKDKRKKIKGGGLSDVVMYPTSTLNSRPPRNNRASPPSNADKNTMRNGNGNGNGNGTEAYYTPTTSPSSPDKIGNKTGSSSWFPMSMPSIGSLLSQPSDENPSTQSGSYQSGRSRESSNQIQPPFAMHSGSMSPTIQNIPSNITNPFSSWSSSDSPTKRSSPRATTRGGQTNPFASKSSSTSPSGQTKKHSNKKIGSRSTSASPPNSNGNGNGDDKRSPLALASRSLSKSPQGSYNQFNPRSRSPTIGDNHRSYSRSPSPVYQRPSRTINTNQSEFHTLLSCAASPDDAQFLDALELLATSRNPRKLAQMKLSDAHDWTALHIAVLSNPPLYLIYALLLVFPEGAKELDNAGRLPLHLSAGNETSVSVLNTLVRFHNNAICEKDDRGYIPLHLALLRDGNEEIPVDVLRIFLGQTVGNGEAVIRLGGGATPRGVRDGYMRNKEHLNLELDEIQGGLLGVSRNATVMRERKRREEMMRLTKNNTREPLSRGFARNIQDVDSQDGDPLKHEHLSSLWMNDAQYQSDPFSDMELEAVNQFSTEVTHCLKQLAQWKKRYDRDQKSETPSKDTESPQIMNPATIPAPPYMRLPLHMAVRRNHKKKSQDGATHRFQTLAPPPNQNEILRILIHAFPPSLMIKDAHDKTPLMTCLALVHHPAIHPVDLNMIELLLGKRSIGYREAPKWLEDIDFSRQHQKSISHHAHEIQQSSRTLATNAAMIPCDETLPLHIAARESLPTSIVHTIYASYPGAKYAQDERDCTPLHSALQNLTGRTTINLEMINMLMDDKVLRIKNSVDQSIFDLLVANAKAGKLPTKFKRIKHAETGKSVKATTIFQPVFHQVIMDEVLASSGERKEEEFLSDLYSLPSTMRRQACGTPSFQYLLLKELASGANAASIFLYGIALLTLAISFSSMVDTFISHRTDDDITTSNTQKTVIFVTNAYLSVHGLLYAAMTINLNISITESLANIWTWVTFIALLLSFIVTVYIGNQERSLGSIDLSDSHLVTMSTIAIGTLWSAFVGYLARWWYGISIFCSSVVKMAKSLVSPLIVLSMFTLAFMQMVYIIHTRNNANNQCLYEGGTENGESLNICSLWDSFKIVYLLVIGEGFIGAEASSGDATIVLLLVFVVLAFILILHTVSLTILNLQASGVKDTMVEAFWSPMLTHVLLIHQLNHIFCFGGNGKKPCFSLTSRLGDMWDYMIVSYSDVDIRDTKWWYLQRDLGRSHLFGKKWFVRMVGFFVIPVWFCIGLATLGILWPPQIRQWIFQVGMDEEDLIAFDEAVGQSDLSQMTLLQSDVSNMKMMMYDRFQSVEDELYELRSTIERIR